VLQLEFCYAEPGRGAVIFGSVPLETPAKGFSREARNDPTGVAVRSRCRPCPRGTDYNQRRRRARPHSGWAGRTPTSGDGAAVGDRTAGCRRTDNCASDRHPGAGHGRHRSGSWLRCRTGRRGGLGVGGCEIDTSATRLGGSPKSNSAENRRAIAFVTCRGQSGGGVVAPNDS